MANEYNVRQAVILVGGKGTRMRPLTDNCPKPILPVLDKPCVKYLIEWFVRAGIEEVFFACGYKSEMMESVIGDGSDMGIRITFSYEDKPMGTGGAIKLLEDRLDDVFMATNGDAFYTEYDALKQIREHFESGADMTMSLMNVEDPSQQGIVRLDKDNNITEFKEKPKPEEMFSKTISTGTYVLTKKVLALIPKGEFCDIERGPFPQMVANGSRIHGTMIDGELVDVGYPHRLYLVNTIMAEKLFGKKEYLGEGTVVKSSECPGTVIHRNCTVENSRLENCLVLEGCRLKNCRLKNCVIGKNCNLSHYEAEGETLGDETINP